MVSGLQVMAGPRVNAGYMLGFEKWKMAILGMVETYTSMLRPLVASKKLMVFKQEKSEGKYAVFWSLYPIGPIAIGLDPSRDLEV